MRVLGIDPGLQVTGYGLLQARGARVSVVEAGVLRTDARQPLEARLRKLHDLARELFRELAPEAIAVEDLYSHYRHPVTAILMGHARGVIFLAAAEAGVSVVSYGATRVKKSLTGAGHASKGQMQRMVQSALGLKALPEPPDVADALAVAMCHCNVMVHEVWKSK